jgi:pimeloyl-ACP methyl ester carboxylesterase
MARLIVRLILLFVLWLVDAAPDSNAHLWTVIAVDPKGDVRDTSLPDAAQLSYRYDKERDMLWFRVSLFGRPDANAFGVNIAVDTGTDGADKLNWWGNNKTFMFDRLITAWVTRADDGYTGTIGISDAAGARQRQLTNVRRDNLVLDLDGDSIVIGLKRTDLTEKTKLNLVAAVGSSQQWNDDIPDARSAMLDLSAPRPQRGLREIDVSRDNLRFAAGETTLPEDAPPRLLEAGHGSRTLILIPGVYSGDAAFEGFMARNASQYTFHLMIPPGLNGTAPRQLPPETTSYGEFTWTRRLERDILDLIERKHLDKPFLVAHGFPGSLAAEELASNHPQLFGGLIEIASMPVQSSPSLRNSDRETTPAERIAVVDDSWAQQWFKYVTPETWESNNYPAVMFANDPTRAERARRQVESTPLPVKIRYLVEYMASDHRDVFGTLNTPLMALIPGFNEKVLADPAWGWFKASFQDAWNRLPGHPQFQLVTIPDARALILDDQPALADRAIAAFVDAHRNKLG